MPAPAVKDAMSRLGGFVLFAIGSVLLIALSIQGYANALRNAPDLQTVPQYLMTGSQFLYSALGPCVVLSRFISSAWFRAIWQSWAVALTVAVALIPWAWIEPSVQATLGFAAVGVACATSICFLVTRGNKEWRLRRVPSDA
jgi:hypothetical protein